MRDFVNDKNKKSCEFFQMTFLVQRKQLYHKPMAYLWKNTQMYRCSDTLTLSKTESGLICDLIVVTMRIFHDMYSVSCPFSVVYIYDNDIYSVSVLQDKVPLLHCVSGYKVIQYLMANMTQKAQRTLNTTLSQATEWYAKWGVFTRFVSSDLPPLLTQIMKYVQHLLTFWSRN